MQYTVARSSAPACYPSRVKLAAGASWDGYDPVDFTDPSVLANAEDLDTGRIGGALVRLAGLETAPPFIPPL